jgi:molecular chaperone DnaJ
MKNYYDILGVNENSSADDIKKAYRKLSKQYHPDVNPNGEEKFKDITEAYEILGNETKKTDYDNRGRNPFGSFNMDDFFGGFGNNKPHMKAPDKVISLDITAIESFFGVNKVLEFNSFNCCTTCDGNGGERKVCGICNGSGIIIQQFGSGMFVQRIQTQCGHCRGEGSVISKRCNSCHGTGLKNIVEKISVSTPKNVDEGDFMRVAGKGDYNSRARTKGDVILKIVMIKTDGYEKIGKDLILSKRLSPIEVLSNEQIEITHPEGNLKIKLPDTFDSEKPLRVPNKGYKYADGNGDFYIKVYVTKPNLNDPQVIQKLESLLENTKNVLN